MMLSREVLRLSRRGSYYFIIVLGTLASIGLASHLIKDPIGFFTSLLLLLALGLIVFMLVRHFFFSNSQQFREQNAFRKAAKRSKKRYKLKDMQKNSGRSVSHLSSFRKFKHRPKSNVQLTVIEGKKGKKKKRASL